MLLQIKSKLEKHFSWFFKILDTTGEGHFNFLREEISKFYDMRGQGYDNVWQACVSSNSNSQNSPEQNSNAEERRKNIQMQQYKKTTCQIWQILSAVMKMDEGTILLKIKAEVSRHFSICAFSTNHPPSSYSSKFPANNCFSDVNHWFSSSYWKNWCFTSMFLE